MSISFESLALGEPIQRALRSRKYVTPSPIQEMTIPHVLNGHDVLGCAQTGTGKTAAFALPILEYLRNNDRKRERNAPRILVLTPTRELAAQIQENFTHYGKHLPFRTLVIFGGVGQNPQVRALQNAPEILVATPGRLLDLMQQGYLRLKNLEMFVVDEADRMLDMGFIHDMRKIIDKLPEQRQSLFFSATMPKSIQELANTILRNPKKVEVTPPATTVEKIDQSICHVAKSDKRKLLDHILRDRNEGKALVFSATKHGANRIADQLSKSGLSAEAIHGNKSQGARERALKAFKAGKVRILVATDIAARGIDVKGIDLVVNFDLPNEPDSYVHRIGRTARAGAEGKAISMCDEISHGLLLQIEKNIRTKIPVYSDHPFHKEPDPRERHTKPPQGRQGGGQRRSGGGGGGRNRKPSGGQARKSYGGGGGGGNFRSGQRRRRTSGSYR